MRHIRRGKNITKHSTVYGCILSAITYLPCASLSAALARLWANDEVDFVFFFFYYFLLVDTARFSRYSRYAKILQTAKTEKKRHIFLQRLMKRALCPGIDDGQRTAERSNTVKFDD